MNKPVTLSIVIISWNSRELLRRCLDSLADVRKRDDVEIVWVDNGSIDNSEELLKKDYPEVRRLVLDRNYGVSFARNRGVELAKGKYILFLDDDTEASAEAIDGLIEHMESNPKTGVAGAALRDEEGNLQDSFKEFPGLWIKVRNVLRSRLNIVVKPELPSDIIHPVYVIGACQMIRHEIFDKIGLLDEAIFYGPEDADFCLRTKEAGWDISYIPSVSIMHHARRITARSLTSPTSRRHIRALIYFWFKHKKI